MKLWKYILGAIAFIGGIFAVSDSAQKKKDETEQDYLGTKILQCVNQQDKEDKIIIK